MRINNRKNQKLVRQYLRTHSTAAEAMLWELLSNKKVEGLKFRRQHGIGQYVVDLYCPEIKLAIELDGGIHTDWIIGMKDKEKEDFLSSQGVTVLRFWNEVVFHDVGYVIEKIIEYKNKWRETHALHDSVDGSDIVVE
ncbi:MAG: DUF559 domain-containing protein [Prevotella sp.]|nr:DUF559 domain-containing protein [Prevotella sp.]